MREGVINKPKLSDLVAEQCYSYRLVGHGIGIYGHTRFSFVSSETLIGDSVGENIEFKAIPAFTKDELLAMLPRTINVNGKIATLQFKAYISNDTIEREITTAGYFEDGAKFPLVASKVCDGNVNDSGRGAICAYADLLFQLLYKGLVDPNYCNNALKFHFDKNNPYGRKKIDVNHMAYYHFMLGSTNI